MDARRRLQGFIAHELVHLWFGDVVTMRWWDNLWLNEGVATFLAARVLDTVNPGFGGRLDELFAIQRAMDADVPPSSEPLRTYPRRLRQMPYDKGAAVLLMLERWIGEEAMRTGLRTYLRENAWGNATTDSLVSALEAASGKELGAIVHAFVDQPGFPVVTVSPTCEQGRLKAINAAQRRPAWPIPLCMTTRAGAAPACVTLREEAAMFPAEVADAACPAWMHPNPKLAGYYRYEVTSEQIDVPFAFSEPRVTGDEARPLVERLVERAGRSPSRGRGAQADRRARRREDLGRARSGAAHPDRDRPEDRWRRGPCGVPALRGRALRAPADRRAEERGQSRRRSPRAGAQALAVRVRSSRSRSPACSRSRSPPPGGGSAEPGAELDPDFGWHAVALGGVLADEVLAVQLMAAAVKPTGQDQTLHAMGALARIEDPALVRRVLDWTLGPESPGPAWTFWLVQRLSDAPASRPVVLEWARTSFDRIQAKWKDAGGVARARGRARGLRRRRARSIRQARGVAPRDDAPPRPGSQEQLRDAAACRDLVKGSAAAVSEYLAAWRGAGKRRGKQ